MNISEARLKQIIKEEIEKRYAEIDDVLLEKLIEESRITRAIAAGGLSLLLALQAAVTSDNEEFRQRMLANAEEAADTRSDRALGDLEKLLTNAAA